MAIVLQDFSWKRMIEAVEAVKERTCRAATALERAGIPYAVAGGNAVAAWVARVDRAAARNTNDVDILVRRSDFEAIKAALEAVGFEYHQVNGIDCFIDGPDGNVRDAVHLLYGNEKVRPTYPTPNADVSEAADAGDYRVLSLDALCRMKLTFFRRIDRVLLRDMLDVGLLDESWLERLIPEHAARLKELIDTPDG